MATRVERAYRRLRDVLQAAVSTFEDGPGTVYRNRVTAVLLDAGRTGALAVMNLVDEKGKFLDQEVNGPGEEGTYDFIQPALLEVVVFDPDPDETDRRFDAIMEMLAEFFATVDDELGGVVSNLSVDEPPDRMVLAAYPGAKAARITINMLITAPTVFG